MKTNFSAGDPPWNCLLPENHCLFGWMYKNLFFGVILLQFCTKTMEIFKNFKNIII